jgi:hypothetical protein
MGVFVGSADRGFADRGDMEEMWEGKLAVTGVESCASLGFDVLAAAMATYQYG